MLIDWWRCGGDVLSSFSKACTIKNAADTHNSVLNPLCGRLFAR
jgi:hypothetical protein